MIEMERAPARVSNPDNYWPANDALLAHVLQGANSDVVASLHPMTAKAADAPDSAQSNAAVVADARGSMARQTAGTAAIGEFRYRRGDHRQSVVAARHRTESVFTTIVAAGRAPVSSETLTRAPPRAASPCSALGPTAVHRVDVPNRPTGSCESRRLAVAMAEASSLG